MRIAAGGFLFLCGWGLAAFSGLVQAQLAGTASSGGLEEVLVTAQRHTENIQSVPISMDAISGATLENLGDKKFFDYAASIPNLTVG